MPNWIREPASRHVAILQHSYAYTREPGSRFMFDVDEKTGHVILTSAAARENHAKALAGVQAGTMTDDGIIDFGRTHWDAGAIRCHCGAVVELSGDWEGTACQQCKTEYNSSGQQLRANWREFCRETGELTDEDFLS